MTINQYLDLWHQTPRSVFFDEVWPSLVNGKWTIDGGEWFPCVIFDDVDRVQPERCRIITRNQTFSSVFPDRVQRL